ncbi:acetylglutamate kinase [Paraneptunicella aestuarii]|uniref:acetylglutamate kinase n=1 Tax=Paraneptunicella aestuarii TaxID=2831148 RepID=UPI001E5CF6C6|nr:acetylglutamate kinase [Paraneptunicella aestuarii]UAA38669.1 acetylglutamate kinase [Paraneptunicella aestuarii]
MANHTPLVIKVGGALLEDKTAAIHFFSTLKQLMPSVPLVLVHGGGNSVENLLKALGLTSEKIDGLRVTPNEHLPYVVGALAGTVNKTLCGWAMQQGIVPVGLSLLDGGICTATQLNEKLGAVGTAKANDPQLLLQVLGNQQLPIVSSIGADANGQLLNVNADEAAAAIAHALEAKLVLLSDVPCVLDADMQPIAELNSKSIEQLIAQGVINGGMAVKVKAALQTANQIGNPVIIASWKTPEQLLGLIQGEAVGTTIHSDAESNAENIAEYQMKLSSETK